MTVDKKVSQHVTSLRMRGGLTRAVSITCSLQSQIGQHLYYLICVPCLICTAHSWQETGTGSTALACDVKARLSLHVKEVRLARPLEILTENKKYICEFWCNDSFGRKTSVSPPDPRSFLISRSNAQANARRSCDCGKPKVSHRFDFFSFLKKLRNICILIDY